MLAMSSPQPQPQPPPVPRRSWRGVKRALAFLVIALVVEYLVLPQIAGARKAASLLAHTNLALVGLGIVLEAASLVAFAQLTRSMLPGKPAPLSLGTTLRIDLASLAVNHVVPGGSAAGAGLGYRLLTLSGVDGSDAGFALATQSIGSAVVLNVLLWLGLVISIPLRGFSPLYGTAAAVGILLIGMFSGLVLLLTKGEQRAARIMQTIARKLPFMDEDAVHQLVHRLAARLRALGKDRSLLFKAVGWAAANWLLDAASLWVFLAAFGSRVGVDSLLVAYGLANVLAAIPITPGGIGVVEAVLTSTLVGFGVTRGVAILGVIGYRLVNFWLPIPVGGVAYLSLRVGKDASTREMAEALRKAADREMDAAEDPLRWAARHGMKVRPSSA